MWMNGWHELPHITDHMRMLKGLRQQSWPYTPNRLRQIGAKWEHQRQHWHTKDDAGEVYEDTPTVKTLWGRTYAALVTTSLHTHPWQHT